MIVLIILISCQTWAQALQPSTDPAILAAESKILRQTKPGSKDEERAKRIIQIATEIRVAESKKNKKTIITPDLIEGAFKEFGHSDFQMRHLEKIADEYQDLMDAGKAADQDTLELAARNYMKKLRILSESQMEQKIFQLREALGTDSSRLPASSQLAVAK